MCFRLVTDEFLPGRILRVMAVSKTAHIARHCAKGESLTIHHSSCQTLPDTHCCLATFWAKDFLHIGFCNSIRQVYSEIDSMIGYLS